MMAGEMLRSDELTGQRAELLPDRETLLFDINIAPVTAVNISLALNAATIGSVAASGAWQDLLVLQQ